MFSSYDLTSFSKKLKAIRKSLGFSQTEVYEKTGINSDTLRRLENGMSIPRFDTFINQSIQLLRIQDKHNVADHYETYLIKYPQSKSKNKISGQSTSHSN